MAKLEKDELQWFYYLVIDRELIPEEPCRALLRDLGPEAALVAVTQAIFDQGLCGDFGALQEAAALARVNARRGPPARTIRPALPKLVEHEPEAKLDLPDLAGVETLSKTDAGAIMRGILGLMRQYGASDLHVSAGSPIYWRKHGRLEMCPPESALTPEAASHLCLSLLDDETVAVFEDQGDVGVALELEGGCRYRANVSYSRSGVTGTYHIVPDEVRTLEDLGFTNHADIARLLENDNGLFLVTGPAGSGKTSTLAALVDVINRKRYCHVITIEDPIEIIYPTGTCFITQRQVGLHTHGYASALKAALREDPDVIVIGEMHDLETMEIAITASETGHLVLATLHTRDAASTLSRLLGVFPPSQQSQIRAMVSESLRGVVCQQLLSGTDHQLVLASELLVNTVAVGNLIREGKTHLLEGVMQTGISAGMQSMDRCLLQLFAQNRIDEQTARVRLRSRDSLARLDKLKDQRPAAAPPPPPPVSDPNPTRRYL